MHTPKGSTWIGDFLKEWADIYPFNAEFKGGSFTKGIRPKVLIVTSNYTPKELFPDPNVHLPIYDRFKMVEMTKRYIPEDLVIIPDSPPRREILTEVQEFPMFPVVREIFSVSNACDIPIGPRKPDHMGPYMVGEDLPYSEDESICDCQECVQGRKGLYAKDL